MPTPFKLSQLAKKLRLEIAFEPKLTSYFNDIGNVIEPFYNATGSTPQLMAFRNDLVELLENEYGKVSRSFLGDVAPSLMNVSEITEGMEKAVDDILRATITQRAPRQAGYILDTAERELVKYSERASAQAAKDGITLTRAQQGKIIASDFKGHIPGKVKLIAQHEIGDMAESTKFIVANVISQELPGLTPKKIWNSTLDEVTRDWHVPADRQIKDLNMPYIVKGQMLMRPKDASMGATLDNILGCRCSSGYHLPGDEVLEEAIRI